MPRFAVKNASLLLLAPKRDIIMLKGRSDKGMDGVFTRIYEIVKRIPRGRVATYGQIAALAGNPRLARVVGYALHVNPDPEHIPCFRVVNREGRVSPAFAFGGENMQIKLLEDEGVELRDGFVDMAKYRWDGR
jgi:methylated-DNA-protein-cysteine methyltransferase-like protein